MVVLTTGASHTGKILLAQCMLEEFEGICPKLGHFRRSRGVGVRLMQGVCPSRGPY